MIYCICGKKENMSVLKATTPYNTTQRIAKDRLMTTSLSFAYKKLLS